MKLYPSIYALSTALTVCICLTACGNEKKNEVHIPTEPHYTDVSTSVPDEFVFPGESTAGTKDTEQAAKERNIKTAQGITSYLSEFVDLAKYTETVSDNDQGYSIYYTCDIEENADIVAKIPCILLGSEKTEVVLPSDITSLLDSGFTILDDVNGETEVQPSETKMVTLCTPETSEIFGFSCTNASSENKPVSDLAIDRLILTSFNNFTLANDISGTSDIKDIAKALGDPCVIAVNVTEQERSFVLEYSFENISLMILADGDTKGVIAIDVTVGIR